MPRQKNGENDMNEREEFPSLHGISDREADARRCQIIREAINGGT